MDDQIERQDKAVAVFHQVDNALTGMRKNMIVLIAALYVIDNEQYYIEAKHETFEHFLIDRDLEPATYRKYIKVFEKICVKNKIKATELEGISINKLSLISNTDNPKEWIQQAKTTPHSDFRKNILESKGVEVKSNAQGIEDYIKRNKGCPQWDGKKCLRGVCLDVK